LAELQPLRVEPVQGGPTTARRWAFYLHRYHYLVSAGGGENLGYLVSEATGRTCLLVVWAAAWRCAPRDQALVWNEAERRQGLHRVANNTRLVDPPLGCACRSWPSCRAGPVSRRIEIDWQAKYGHGWTCWRPSVEGDRFCGHLLSGGQLALGRDDPGTHAVRTATTRMRCRSGGVSVPAARPHPMNALPSAGTSGPGRRPGWTAAGGGPFLAGYDAVPALCPQSGQRLSNPRWRAVQLHTWRAGSGSACVNSYSRPGRAWVCPAREAGVGAYSA